MRKLILPALLLPLMFLAACHPERRKVVVEESPPVVPSGGLDWGAFNHFEHDFAQRSISSSSDQDGFEFYLNQSSLVVITVTGSGGLDAYLDLYDSGFDFIVGDDDGGPGNDPIIVGSLSAGGYFVVAGGFGSSTGDYDIDISVEPLGGADFGVLQINDSFVDNGGDISDAFDVDSYVFTVNTNVIADFYVTLTTGDYDGNLELLNEYGQVLAYHDPAGLADPFLINQALTPGTYIVRVGASSGSGDY